MNSSNSVRSLRSASGAILMSDRRQRSRLRDLCDEVLASFRAASGRETISEHDREVADQILPRMTIISR